jgi:hypothetical protein
MVLAAAPAPPPPQPLPPQYQAPPPPVEEKADFLSSYCPKSDVTFRIADMGAPILFASLRDWRWTIRDAKGPVFELALQYSYTGKQNNLTLYRGPLEIAFAVRLHSLSLTLSLSS